MKIICSFGRLVSLLSCAFVLGVVMGAQLTFSDSLSTMTLDTAQSSSMHG